MNRLFALFFGSVIRWALTLIAGTLIAHGVVSENAGNELVAGLALSLPPLLWGMWQKYKTRLKYLLAMELPAQASEAEIKARLRSATLMEKVRFVVGGVTRQPVSISELEQQSVGTVPDIPRVPPPPPPREIDPGVQ